jgi:hypothetical protein
MDEPIKQNPIDIAHDLALLCVKRQLDDESIKSDSLSVFEAYKIAYDDLYGYLTRGT